MNELTRTEVERVLALAQKAHNPKFGWFNKGAVAVENTVDAALICACEPETIIAICNAALRGMAARGEAVGYANVNSLGALRKARGRSHPCYIVDLSSSPNPANGMTVPLYLHADPAPSEDKE